MSVSEFNPKVHKTANGAPYLTEAGVALKAQTRFNARDAGAFLGGFGVESDFAEYLNDPDALADADGLVKFAGQLCYLSFGPKRTWNKDASKYFDNIKRQGHGSVLEHASFTLLFWGIDRACTHELVRHRHMSFSQVSQRYVGAETLRFVMRPEFQGDDARSRELASEFKFAIERAMESYLSATAHLRGDDESTTAARKAIRQAARYCLPNCAEAPILVTGNARAWRGLIDQRATVHADLPIRDAAVKALKILRAAAPLCFEDYEIFTAADGREAALSPYKKV